MKMCIRHVELRSWRIHQYVILQSLRNLFKHTHPLSYWFVDRHLQIMPRRQFDLLLCIASISQHSPTVGGRGKGVCCFRVLGSPSLTLSYLLPCLHPPGWPRTLGRDLLAQPPMSRLLTIAPSTVRPDNGSLYLDLSSVVYQ